MTATTTAMASDASVKTSRALNPDNSNDSLTNFQRGDCHD